MNMMKYKNYIARIEFDDDDRIFVGRLAGIDDIVSFHGTNGGLIGFAMFEWVSGAPSYIWLLTSQAFALLMQFIYFKLMQQNLTSCSSGTI